MTNFMDEKMARRLAKKLLKKDPELPHGSELWVYSDWEFLDYAPKLSYAWWWDWCLKFIKIIMNGYKFFASVNSKFYFYD